MGRKRARHQRGRRGQSKQRKPHALVTGVLRVLKPGMAELHTAEGTFDVARGGIREAMSGDEVQATLSSSRDGRRLARVQSVLVRNTTMFAGVYRRLEPLGAVVPLDTRVKRDFFVVPEDKSPERLGVAEGDLVRARIVEYPTRHSAGIVTIDARIGSSDDVDMNVESVIASYDLATEFPRRRSTRRRACTRTWPRRSRASRCAATCATTASSPSTRRTPATSTTPWAHAGWTTATRSRCTSRT